MIFLLILLGLAGFLTPLGGFVVLWILLLGLGYPSGTILSHGSVEPQTKTCLGVCAMSHSASEETINKALNDLPQWRYEDHALVKDFVFANFREAISFLVRVGFDAEARNHHPEIKNVYNKVEIRLTTHDAGNQVTEKDLALARAIESFNWVK